jgi:hypothetical protein
MKLNIQSVIEFQLRQNLSVHAPFFQAVSFSFYSGHDTAQFTTHQMLSIQLGSLRA